MMDSAEHGVMRVVFEEPGKARDVLTRLNMAYNETEVLCVNLANKAGALATVAEKLATGHINISYAYCTAGAKGGRTTGVLKVSDVKKAMKLLENHNKESRDTSGVRQSKGQGLSDGFCLTVEVGLTCVSCPGRRSAAGPWSGPGKS